MMFNNSTSFLIMPLIFSGVLSVIILMIFCSVAISPARKMIMNLVEHYGVLKTGLYHALISLTAITFWEFLKYLISSFL